MKKRQNIMKNRNKNENPPDDDKTFSVPKIVAEPKTDKEKNMKILQSNREKNENFLEENYLDPIQKLSRFDLGIINEGSYYPENKKKDRHYNRGVNRAITDLHLLDFLLTNLKPYYKNQIFTSQKFVNIIQKYLGIDDSSTEPTKEEKAQVLATALQMLTNSLTVIEKLMPSQFYGVLKQNGKPYFDMIEAISNFARVNDIKKIPQIHIPDSVR